MALPLIQPIEGSSRERAHPVGSWRACSRSSAIVAARGLLEMRSRCVRRSSASFYRIVRRMPGADGAMVDQMQKNCELEHIRQADARYGIPVGSKEQARSSRDDMGGRRYRDRVDD